MTMLSKTRTMAEADRRIIWHAFSQMLNYRGLIIESAEGCWLQTTDGKRYLDGASSLWCNVHGHRHPTIDRAILKQLGRVAHVTSLGMSHPITIQLAERLVEQAPSGLGHVFFSGDGASAVEVAMKMAFQYWRQCPNSSHQRDLFLAVGNAYHGDTLGTCSVGGVSSFRDLFQPLLFRVLRGPSPWMDSNFEDDRRLVRSTGNLSISSSTNVEDLLACYEALLQAHEDKVAAVIVEPMVQAAAGVRIQPPGFLRGLRALTKKYDTLLIADEVAVGFGRTGQMFACEHESVTPDLFCLGKGLTGGYLAMSATLCTSAIWEAFLGDTKDHRTFFHGHTYAGNPLAAAAANATLDIFEDEKTLAHLPEKSRFMKEGLQRLTRHPVVAEVRQMGLLGALELRNVGELPGDQHQLISPQEVCHRLLDYGTWLRPLGNSIPIVPPLAITIPELEHLFDGLDEALQAGL